MKALFTGFFSVSLSGGLIICLILLLRPFLKKAPKSVICILWALAIFRLLLPFQLENPLSVRPQTPVITQQDIQFVIGTPDLGYLVSPDVVAPEYGQVTSRIDYVAIASLIWGAISALMLLYMVISYWILRFRVRKATRLENGAYVHPGLDSAFLLGYLKPRIYLPAYLEEEQSLHVIAHETAHRKRGDNWLKLAGFVCLALHWYNPMVWVAYILLCRDIEDACDAYVVRDLEVEGRKAYSAALLSCCRKHKKLPECPVAFGEYNIAMRIKQVLKYRKPVLWICVAAVVVTVIATVFFFTDPVPDYSDRHPAGHEQLKSLLGKPKDVVFSELGLKEEEMEVVGRALYFTPISVEFQSVTFDVSLEFFIEDNSLYYIYYTKEYEGNSQQAASDAVTVGHHYSKYLDNLVKYEDDVVDLRNITNDDVVKIYANPEHSTVGVSSLRRTWSLHDEVDRELQVALDKRMETSQWMHMGGAYGIKAGYVLTYNTYYDPEIDQTVLKLTYGLGPVKIPQHMQREIVPPTWWEKLIAWTK